MNPLLQACMMVASIDGGMMMQKLVRVSMVLVSALLIQGAWAGDGMASHPMDGEAMPPRHEAGHHQPPPEALAACKGKSKGAVCDMESPDDKQQGACMAPEGKPLACVPDHPPRREKGEKPPVLPAN